MFSQIIQIILAGCIVSVRGTQEGDSKRCSTKGTSDCFQYTVCTDEVTHDIFPGRIKTLVQDAYLPRGLTKNAFTNLSASADMSVIISDVYLAIHDDSLTMSNRMYKPKVTERKGKRVHFSTGAIFDFGDLNCNGTREFVNVVTDSTANPVAVSYSINSSESSYDTDSTTSSYSPTADVIDHSTDSSTNTGSTTPNIVSEDLCTFCLLRLAVDYLMADISDVSENLTRTVSSTFVFEKVQIEVASILVLRLKHNSSRKSYFSTDIPDVVDFPLTDSKAFQLDTVFLNPLSSYKLVLKSSDSHLRIATVRIDAVGEHYESIIAITSDSGPDDEKYCLSGPDTLVIDFGYLPNKGAYDNNASIEASIIVFKVILSLTHEANSGKTYPLQIDLEVDSMLSMTSTKYFHAIDRLLVQQRFIDFKKSQTNPLISKSESGIITIIWDVPLLSSGQYSIKTSSKRYAGPGGDGLIVTGIEVYNIGSNFLCVSHSLNWKMGTKTSIFIRNIPYSIKSVANANTLGFQVSVLALPHLVEAFSSHELTVTLDYVGQGSPQSFKFYFNISDQERFLTPDVNGNLPLNIYFYEKCQSITSSTDVVLTLHTDFGGNYGRLLVELPVPSDLVEQSFALCDFRIWNGFNVLQLYHTNITRRDDGMIEKVLVEFEPLSNVHFLTADRTTVNYVTMEMVVTFIDKSLQINNLSKSFSARIISNSKTVWTQQLPITKPSIEHYPDVVVVRGIEKSTDVNPQNLWFHYSLNGTLYNQDALVWENGRNVYLFEFPKIIAYFYFSTDPCTVICNVTTDLQPLTDYVSVVNDNNNLMLRKLPYALDLDLDTCFDIPVPGDSPSMLWLRITELSLFSVTSKRFVVHITGENIECGIGHQKSIWVGTSGPANNHHCSIESDIVFCKSSSNHANATKTRCDIECECETLLQCSNVHIVMQSADKNIWKFCELTIEDVT